MPFGLPPKIIDAIQAYFKQYPEVECVKVYGSRAMGTEKPGSDIDLAIFSNQDKTILVGKILGELEELSTPYLFDVTDYAKIEHPPLKDHIDRVGKIIYKKK
ncbi:MAG: hypothetical protein A3F18_05340 [Legionellales bacterium RIFCSPHIGHO2_12_FULL_37_14]|nr:MAG: hypothetical protein A3F18_05340 [Legionellales bacterium RIFCSPHIGHO2_12_FULL_37_14]